MRRIWPRTHYSLWIAGALYGLGILIIISTAAINRLGPERGRLSLDDCRLVVADQRSGLFSMLYNGNDGLRLLVATDLAMPSHARSLSERLGSGPLVSPADSTSQPSLFGYIVLDASRKAGAAPHATHAGRPLMIVDGARDVDQLVQTYGSNSERAIARGVLRPADSGKEQDRTLRLAVDRPTLPKGARHVLNRLPLPDETDNTCRARFLLDIRYGALGHPWVSGLRPLSGPAL